MRKLAFFRKRTFSLKQEALFHLALNEFLIPKKQLRIDHESGHCYNNGKEYSVIFPLSFFRLIKGIETQKTVNYFFTGQHNKDRDWVKYFEAPNNQILFTNKGREISKTTFDYDYYKGLKQAKFAICPKGDFTWTYRFIESAMCKAIPIIDSSETHPMMEGFIWYDYKEQEKHIFKEEIVNHNYRLAVQRHSLLMDFLDSF
ncbi:MAG TPA: exostosin family protein [Bacteroidales bacterium]|nr:exostosin family protein [Bacteroidales bacterium]